MSIFKNYNHFDMQKSSGMNLPFCLAIFEQVIASTNHAGSFQLFMSVNKKREDKKNVKIKFSNNFMSKNIYFLVTLKSFF